jgi:hypothetical protein
LLVTLQVIAPQIVAALLGLGLKVAFLESMLSSLQSARSKPLREMQCRFASAGSWPLCVIVSQVGPRGIVPMFRPQLAVMGRTTAFKCLIDWVDGNGC